jgi:hypothetical protein
VWEGWEAGLMAFQLSTPCHFHGLLLEMRTEIGVAENTVSRNYGAKFGSSVGGIVSELPIIQELANSLMDVVQLTRSTGGGVHRCS